MNEVDNVWDLAANMILQNAKKVVSAVQYPLLEYLDSTLHYSTLPVVEVAAVAADD